MFFSENIMHCIIFLFLLLVILTYHHIWIICYNVPALSPLLLVNILGEMLQGLAYIYIFFSLNLCKPSGILHLPVSIFGSVFCKELLTGLLSFVYLCNCRFIDKLWVVTCCYRNFMVQIVLAYFSYLSD